MSKKESVIGKVLELKDEYYHLKESIDESALMYPELLRIRKELSCLSVDLAVETSKYTRDFKNSQADYEITRYMKQRELMTQKGERVTAADALARQYAVEKLKDVAVNEGLHKTGTMILAQINEVLKSLNQDISIIKKEYERLTDS